MPHGRPRLGPSAPPVDALAQSMLRAVLELVVDDPFLLTEASRLPLADANAVELAVARTHAASRAWAGVALASRIALVERAIAELEAHAEAIVADVTRMMGKPIAQARRELSTMAARSRHMAKIAPECLAPRELPSPPNVVRRIERVPHGVVLDLPAWNYPLLTAVNAVVPAVIAGNSVLLKHSPRSPLVGEHFAAAFERAGAPSGLVTYLHADHDSVAHVCFTGSVQGGRAVYTNAAAHRFIDVGLELGGKDAAYVRADADPESTAAALVDGACYNAGQSCCAVERIYVHRDRYDAFVEAARAELAKFTMGDPRTDVYLGPLAQPQAPQFLERQVREAERDGARVLCGGRPTTVDGHGRFFEPTLLVDVHHRMDVMRTESFGPIVAVMAVDSDEQAVALINDSDLGLTASLWTADRDRAFELGARLEVGTVYVNACDVLDPALPWTGTKDSGKGSTLSDLGYLHLTRPRALFARL